MSGPPRGAADRVLRAHRQVRWTAPFVALFVAAALTAAATSDRWAALHLALAGGTVLLVSAVALMLTVTWAAAPAPSDRVVALQRAAVAVGVAVLVGGREGDAPSWVPVAGVASYAAGLALLAGLLVVTVRRGVQRRFDVPVAGYVVALAAGIVGAVLGARLVVGPVTVEVRDAHRVLNLLGLVGVVASSTLPFFAATVGRSKMAVVATPRRLVAALVGQAGALVLTVGGLATATPAVAAVGLGLYAAGLVVVMALLPRPTRRQLRWAGPRLVALWAGTAWWAVAVAVAAAQAAAGRSPLTDPWTVVLVVAGYGQVVWGSLAYLLPVLRGGGHERLSAGFAVTRSWPGLAAVNVVGAALLADLAAVATVALALWCLDAAVRAAVLVAGWRAG